MFDKRETKLNLERTEKQYEGFYLTPFKLDGEKYADEFKLTAEVSACPLGKTEDQCGFEDGCDEKRYENLPWYPDPNNVTGRRRRRETTVKAQTKTSYEKINIYHPCKVVSEDEPKCFLDENGQPGKGAFKSWVWWLMISFALKFWPSIKRLLDSGDLW